MVAKNSWEGDLEVLVEPWAGVESTDWWARRREYLRRGSQRGEKLFLLRKLIS